MAETTSVHCSPYSTEQSPREANSHSASQETPRLRGSRRFITVFTTICHWSLCWSRRIQVISSQPTSL